MTRTLQMLFAACQHQSSSNPQGLHSPGTSVYAVYLCSVVAESTCALNECVLNGQAAANNSA